MIPDSNFRYGSLSQSSPGTARQADGHPGHLFLTGPKQIGKSTVLRALLEGRELALGGFLTVRIFIPGGASIHMIRPGEHDFTLENRVFCRLKGVLHLDSRDFDRIGCALLADRNRYDLLLMDELGPTEAQADAFRQAVLDTLDGNVPVYGILQEAESAFLSEIAAREDVTVVTVTEENRDSLPDTLRLAGW